MAWMSKSRLPERLMLSRVRDQRLSRGQEDAPLQNLQHFDHFDLPLAFTDWACHRPPQLREQGKTTSSGSLNLFVIGKPFLEQLRGDTRVMLSTTLEDILQGHLRRKHQLLTPAHPITIRELYPLRGMCSSHRDLPRYQQCFTKCLRGGSTALKLELGLAPFVPSLN
jgi:hypothetical protein